MVIGIANLFAVVVVFFSVLLAIDRSPRAPTVNGLQANDVVYEYRGVDQSRVYIFHLVRYQIEMNWIIFDAIIDDLGQFNFLSRNHWNQYVVLPLLLPHIFFGADVGVVAVRFVFILFIGSLNFRRFRKARNGFLSCLKFSINFK